MAETVGSKIAVCDGFADGDSYVPMDRFLRMIQALAQLNVISYTVSGPPGSPVEGDTYLVPAGATGAWTGKDQNVAYWTLHDLANPGGVWEFYDPLEGWWGFNNADGNFYQFNGSVWVVKLGPPGNFQALPGWWTSGMGSNYPAVTTAAGQWGTGTANQVKFWMVQIDRTIVIGKLNFRALSGLGGSHSGFAVYTGDGATKLLSWDNFSTAGGGNLNTTLGSPVTISPGIYIIACACDTTGTPPTTLGGYAATGTNEGVEPWNTNGTIRSGTAANPMVAGNMPASLGVLSPGGGGFVALPLVMMEPAA